MDLETVEALAGLRTEMRDMREELRGEMRGMAAELRGDMRDMREELRAEFREGLAENRRHSEDLFESLHDDIRIIAEGLATLATKVDRLTR